jgi:predicted RNase H-like HicB family nuclease
MKVVPWCNAMTDDLRYEIDLYWSAEDEAFLAEVVELAGCKADGATYEEALEKVKVIMQEWLDTARQLRRPIPVPRGRQIKQSLNANELTALLAEIESHLVGFIPNAIKQLQVTNRAYCVFLVYLDSTVVGDHAPFLAVGVDELRQEFLANDQGGQMPWWDPYGASGKLRHVRCDKIVSEVERCYQIFFSGSESSSEDDVMLRPFRESLHSVARRLNQIDWRPILPITDDFAVVVIDGTAYWLDEDISASVPADRLELLRSRGLL